MSTKEKGVCVLCGGEYSHFGNNPQPLSDVGRACDVCNQDVIIARLQMLQHKADDKKYEQPSFLRKAKK